ncbi:MAG: TonB-dependent receptor [Saprospiraceae bacterium]|nr:TonB-dependent receptor [Saprospiraceae bacterium]
MKTYFLCLLFFTLSAISVYSQKVVQGQIQDQDGNPLIGATIKDQISSSGTVTDLEGNFSLEVEAYPAQLLVSYLGYQELEVAISSGLWSIIQMKAKLSHLDEIVVVGNRSKARSILQSPVPIDNINASEFRSVGQYAVDQLINFKIPSYNATQQTVSDATAHFDPSELRNLGPSRTLVLVNGKRRHQSALVYVNDTPGKGEVGVDMKSIPASAIERIEVLRDGASAQYGSDAIAGVINIILKKRPSSWQLNLESGVTAAGDGFTYSADFNNGLQIGKSGFLNFTGSLYHQDDTDRAGEPGGDGLFGVIFGDDDILNGKHPFIQKHPDLGMNIGQPSYDRYASQINLELPYHGRRGTFYAFGGFTYREGKSFAAYRTPYWIPSDFGLLTPDDEEYEGFLPTFEASIKDYNATVGNRFENKGWKTDISLSAGGNGVDYLIGNTINVALGETSPTSFDPGGYAFSHILGNLDVSKNWGSLSVAWGLEARQETFEVRAGQEESYLEGGAQSFPGLRPENALNENRANFGSYLSLDWDASKSFLLGGAIRYENYSDFGDNLSWKLNARQLIGKDKGAIRASVSTGFRAPSLHQIYLSNIQTLISGGTISNQGTFNNVSPVIQGLGVPSLDAETAFNISAGVTYKFNTQFSMALDFYQVDLNDRVLFTGEIGFDGDDTQDNPVEEVLKDFEVTSIKFFVNAMDTRTQGIDLVANYEDIPLSPKAKLGLSWALNYNETKIDGQIQAPPVFAGAGYDIFNRKEQARVTTARPNLKSTFGMQLEWGAFQATLNNTYFGEVTWQHASDPGKDQTFGAKVITDLILGYELSQQLGFYLTINNLLDIYPDPIDPKGDFITDLGGRFKYPWEVNQFGFNGLMGKVGLQLSL